MVRIITVKKFVNNRNKSLLRWPKGIEVGGDAYASFGTFTTNGGSEFRRFLLSTSHLVNHTSYRYNSSSNDGNATMYKYQPLKKSKKKYPNKSLITEVMNNSSTVTNESVELMRKKSFEKFVHSLDLAKSVVNPIRLPQERPVLLMPDNFELDPVKNKALITNLLESLEEFLQKNTKPINDADERDDNIPQKSNVTEVDTELQRKFHPDLSKVQIPIEDSLRAYISTCCNVDYTERAYVVLKHYREKLDENGTRVFKLRNPEICVELMAKYGMKKNWQRVDEIYKMLLEDDAKITPQVYMVMLDCLGRSPGNNKPIKKCIEMAMQRNISINDIMDKSTFTGDQRYFVLEAIRRHTPDFVPIYTPPNLGYENKLLDFMNSQINPIEKKPHELIENADICDISKPKLGFTAEQLKQYAMEQFSIEADGQIDVKNIQMLDSQHHIDNKVIDSRKKMNELFSQWQLDTTASIRKKLNILRHKMRTTSMKDMNIFPYLILLKPEELSEILLDELKKMAQGSEHYSPTVYSIYTNIGRTVMRRHQVSLQKQNGVHNKIKKLYETYCEILSSGKCSENPRQLWQRIIHHSRDDGPCLMQKRVNWPWTVQVHVGRILFKVLAENLKIDANITQTKKPNNVVPVIYSLFRNRELRSREEIRLHPAFVGLYRDSKFDIIHFNAHEVPMLCPPMPWTSIDSGGYLISKSDLVRIPYDCQKQYEMIRKVSTVQMYPPFDTLNQLSSIPWRINTRILDLAIKIFNMGGNEKLHVPLTPDSLLTDEQLKYRNMTRNELIERRKSNDTEYAQNQRDLYSLYSDTLYKLSLANHFRDRPFWLPHNMDFRGRTYPIPPHLTHLSADLTRSMLQFHQKQPLGQYGLDWLKIHCINLTGLKKRESIEDRLLYAESIMDDILDSADNPLDGRQWWLNSDDPWQTLAACIEIANASRLSDPSKYLSAFPIHQDGSCNGLQHYAALGRDIGGAASVNLAPATIPQDVYTTITNRVEEWRAQDALSGNEVALALDGLIKRKIIKQTVMTTVYGVTRYGAKLQIKKQLKNINFNPKLIDKAAVYLATATFGSLSETFSSAREIQNWFGLCASTIAKHNHEHVEWTSPLGLPIIQPYTRKKARLSSVELTNIQAESVVNTMKEKNAFSPNFIHSLDSCHMMLTALNCERAGVTFVSVHDCFWTHANTIPIMSRICREQFVLLHSQPILEDLAESFCQKFKEIQRVEKKKRRKSINSETVDKPTGQEELFRAIPEKGQFDLEKVLESPYFFS